MFADKRARAMTLAFDRQRIIENVYAGLGTIATARTPDSPNNDLDIRTDPVQSRRAKKLLSEAGWTDTDGDWPPTRSSTRDGAFLRPNSTGRRRRQSKPSQQKSRRRSPEDRGEDDRRADGVGLLQKRKDEREFHAFAAA
jgi:ABC-type transport system substrate-binding protein